MRTPKLLSERQLEKFAKDHSAWKLSKDNTKATMTLTFDSHTDAMVYIVRLTVHAEVLQHHPDIHFTYKQVNVSTTTHESGGLTRKDLELISRAEKLSTFTKGDK